MIDNLQEYINTTLGDPEKSVGRTEEVLGGQERCGDYGRGVGSTSEVRGG